MKGSDVVKQLAKILPQYTQIFHPVVNITSMTLSPTYEVTVVTASAHGLNVNDEVTVTGALAPFDIATITNDGKGTAFAETVEDHDLTQAYEMEFKMEGADQAEYNGVIQSKYRIDNKTPPMRSQVKSYELMAVPNRRNFSYSIDGVPVTPATGTIRFLQHYPIVYNGYHKVETVVSPTELKYTSEYERDLGSPAAGDIKLHLPYRITNVINPQRMLDVYTKQLENEAWAFVILGDQTVSRDMGTSDLVVNIMRGRNFAHVYEQEYSVFVSLPTKTSIGGGDFADFFSNELIKYLVKSLVLVPFENEFEHSKIFKTSFKGTLPFIYTKAFHIQEYKFSQPYLLTMDDAFDEDTSVAFRNADLKFDNKFETVIMEANVDLDEEPLP